MSDYGDDYSDGDEWLYVEDEYLPADDLAEHVVNSPPPITYADEDAVEDWDRFDYFNDIEYASDGYDDAKFYTHKAQTGQAAETILKRKRAITSGQGGKKQKVGDGQVSSQLDTPKGSMQPVVWRSRADREIKPKPMDEHTETYALLKDWRERLANAPAWSAISSHCPTSDSKSKALPVLEAEEEEEEEGGGNIDPSVLMAALQKNLAVAGGPLAGMDPQQLLQFAMRMMNDDGAGDDIAGELAENILNGEEYEEDDEECDEGGLYEIPDTAPRTYLSKSPKSPKSKPSGRRPPMAPSSEANRNHAADPAKAHDANAFKQNDASLGAGHEAIMRKRKASEGVDVGSGPVSKKRTTRAFEAPTAASQMRAVPAAKPSRVGRKKTS